MKRANKTNPYENDAIEPNRRGEDSRLEAWPGYNPFSVMRRMADEMDLMLEGFGFPRMGFGSWGGGSPWRSEGFLPEIEMVERNGKLVITADLPGLTKDDVKVEITNDSIILEGERKSDNEERERGMYRSERRYGQFHRQIRLPEGVRTDTANATFNDGVLEVTIDAPRLAQNRRRIQIQDKGSGKEPGRTAA